MILAYCDSSQTRHQTSQATQNPYTWRRYDVTHVTRTTYAMELRATLRGMENSHQDAPVGWHKFGIIAGWVATFVFAAWILLPRLIIGTTVAGAMAVTVILTVVILAIGCVTLGVPAARKKTPSKRAVAWLWIAFSGAFVVGLFLPDDTIFSAINHDQATALVAVWFGAGWEAAGSAIANPAAIIMTITGIIGAVFSVLDSRPGGPVRTEDEDHLQGHGPFAILGEDEYYRP